MKKGKEKMTEQEMRERMKEIDDERNRLRAERQEYEDYFERKRQEARKTEHQQHIGKCYVKHGPSILKNNANLEGIVAFKILKVLPEPQEHRAECLVIADGYRYSSGDVRGITIENLSLWAPAFNHMMAKPTDPKVIDNYKECTIEEFADLYKKYMEQLLQELGGKKIDE